MDIKLWHIDKSKFINIKTDIEKVPEEGFLWIDGSVENLPQIILLTEKLLGLQLHERHLSDCKNPEHPSSFESMKHYSILIFRMLQPGSQRALYNPTNLTFIIFDKMLITLHASKYIDELNKRLPENSRMIADCPVAFIYQMLHGGLDVFLEIRKAIVEKFEYWQDVMLDEKNPFKNWKGFLNYKSNIRRMYVNAEEQLDAISQWKQAFEFSISENFIIKIKDLQSHIRRVTRFTEQQQMQIDTLLQSHYSIVANRLNDVMRIIAVISGIFMPLTLISGIFGMNFIDIPFLKMATGFWICMGSMLFISIMLLYLFWRAKWI